jgi:hypothetical protein
MPQYDSVNFSTESATLAVSPVGLLHEQFFSPGEIRFWHAWHTSNTSHSGHRFQFSLTGWPQSGHVGDFRRASHIGQIFQLSLTGSPHWGQRGNGVFSGIVVSGVK